MQGGWILIRKICEESRENMRQFLITEKTNQIQFKLTSPTISPSARVDGIYKKHTYPFCLPVEHAAENLPPEIRAEAIAWFAERGIHWHDGAGENPSNHLCDSQVCCVNFLFPFGDQPEALKRLLLPLYPHIDAMLPIEGGRYVSFEWIGARNYLGERVRPPVVPPNPSPIWRDVDGRIRGANCTSTDAAVMFHCTDGRMQIVLIEWKYTESYGSFYCGVSKSGTDRTAIYRPFFEQEDSPLRRELIPSFEALFYEPFYQFMRQQFLVREMEMAHELGADVVSLLHISPARNLPFRRVTSPELQHLGESATGVWAKLVKDDRFRAVSTEALFGEYLRETSPEMRGWGEYIQQRYRWIWD